MSLFSEAQAFKRAVEEIVKPLIERQTRACFRVYKAKVIQAPYTDPSLGAVCQVQLNGDNTVLTLPYSSKTAGMAVGDTVLVATVFNSFRNAIVWETRNFN